MHQILANAGSPLNSTHALFHLADRLPPPPTIAAVQMAKRKTGRVMALTVRHGETKKSARKRTVKKMAAKIEVMKPKKPPTAFFYFLEDFRKRYQEQNPDNKSMCDIGKACGEKWKTMPYEESVEFDEEESDMDDDSEFHGYK